MGFGPTPYFLLMPSSLWLLVSRYKLATAAILSLFDSAAPYFLILSLVPFCCWMLPLGTGWSAWVDSLLPVLASDGLLRMEVMRSASLLLFWVSVFS